MKPSNEIMTQTEMIEAEKKTKSSSIYKVKSMEASDKAISESVVKGLHELEMIDKGGKIDLENVNLVKAVSKEYIRACATSSTFPTMNGLARSMGLCSGTLYYWMREKSTTDTAKWFEILRDLFADILQEGALRNNANPVVSIFILKARFGLKDNAPAEDPKDQERIMDEERDRERVAELRRKYADLLIPE